MTTSLQNNKKGTIIGRYMEEMGGSDRFAFSVSHTTRDPRPGEMDGVHYHFVAKSEMEQQIEDGQFLEHAEVHGNLYGTSKQAVHGDAQKRCLLDIDVQGVKNIKQQESNTFRPKYIFIAPPSLEILLERLSNRGTETQQSLERRTANAKAEVEYGMQEGNFDCIVVNDNLDQACQDFHKAIDKLYNS